MRILGGLGLTVALFGAAAAAAVPAGGTPPPVTVRFAAALDARLDAAYGAAERDTLRAIVVDSLDRALERRARRVAIPAGIRVEVLFADALPSHPTRAQSLANPSLDPFRSRSLGGADLRGTVRAADGQVLLALNYDYYAPDLASASPGGDPWADARLAIDRFAAQLAARLGPAG